MRQGSRLKINLRNLEDNFQGLISLNSLSSKQVVVMVKANAYGHGMREISDFCYSELDVKSFGVATLGEGLSLRKTLPMNESEVYVFSDYSLDNHKDAAFFSQNKLIPVLYSLSLLKDFLENSECLSVPLCLKFNTGMNRLGIRLSELEEVISLLKKYKRKNIYHLMSHLANSGLSLTSHGRNKLQKDQYENLLSTLKSSGIEIECSSFSNSGAIEQEEVFGSSHIRPGLMLYGVSALSESIDKSLHLKTLSTLESNILHQFNVERGEPVGYGSHPVIQEGVVAILALGYGDGFLNCYKGHLVESESGQIGKVLKPINMDMTQVWFEKALGSNEKVFLWKAGEHQLLDLCKLSGMIAYEVMCSINQRIPREYFY